MILQPGVLHTALLTTYSSTSSSTTGVGTNKLLGSRKPIASTNKSYIKMLQLSRNNTKYTFFISPFVVKASIVTSLLEKCECLCAHLEDDALLLLGLESGLSLLSVSEFSRWESISVLPPRLCLDLLSTRGIGSSDSSIRTT